MRNAKADMALCSKIPSYSSAPIMQTTVGCTPCGYAVATIGEIASIGSPVTLACCDAETMTEVKKALPYWIKLAEAYRELAKAQRDFIDYDAYDAPERIRGITAKIEELEAGKDA